MQVYSNSSYSLLRSSCQSHQIAQKMIQCNSQQILKVQSVLMFPEIKEAEISFHGTARMNPNGAAAVGCGA